MTSEEFVKRIRLVVYDATVEGTVSLLEEPPGRCPSPGLVRLSQWFNRLSPEDKDYVRGIIEMAAGGAVFHMLTVLDGDLAILTAEEKHGSLELRYNTREQSVLLNAPTGEPLHDIFGGLVPPP